METNTHKELIARKQEMLLTSGKLKEKFLGLDYVIDEVFSLMMPWFLFPDAQLRPTVINLWGLTGSGKTALVQGIVESLNHKKLFSHIDMGEFESDSASWVKNIFTDDLSFFDEKPAIICLDEFQFARTLDGNGNELGKDKLRVIWDLVDTGKIEYIPGHSTYWLFRADNCIKRLDRAIGSGVKLLDGEVVSDKETFVSIFDGFYFDRASNKQITTTYFTSQDFVQGLFSLFDNDAYSMPQILQRVKASSLEELRQFVAEGLQARPATKTLDLSRSLIFVLGNLDEAYSMSGNLNPDINADEFHEQTSKITIAHIKRALRKRFRPEQIARLGNNHVIYRSFNSGQFRMLIRAELARVGTFVKSKFGWEMTFDESVVNVVYAEGVFPAQGTRPVLTTIKNLIESRIASLAVSILEYQLDIKQIVWTYAHETFSYALIDELGRTLSVIDDPARLKLENLRKSVDPEIQAHTAVHEAGHAVLAALTLRIVPSMVVSRTAADAEGFCLVNFPKGPMTKETLRKDIVITLGGYVAEKMIFGDAFTCSGVYDDIKEASSLANRAVREYAMGTDPIHLAIDGSQNHNAFIISERYGAEAIKIVKECERDAWQMLENNKLLLLKMSEYLTYHSKMDEALIAEFVMKYGRESWIHTSGLIKKDEYYQFNKVLQEQLQQVGSDSVQKAIENLICEVEEH